MDEVRCCRLAHCGKPLKRKPGEKLNQFKKRLYCGIECSSQSPNRNRPKNGKKEFIIPSSSKTMIPYPNR